MRSSNQTDNIAIDVTTHDQEPVDQSIVRSTEESIQPTYIISEGEINSNSIIDLVIRTIHNSSFSLAIGQDKLILDVKCLLKDLTDIEVERQRLIFRGAVLEDDRRVDSYAISSGNILHLVTRPANFRELQTIAETSLQSTQQELNNSLFTSIQQLQQRATEAMSSISNNSAQLLSQLSSINDNSILSGTTSEESHNSSSLEHIHQGLLGLNTLRHYQRIEESRPQFVLGQWVDCKDTVNQWLEATVLQVDNDNNRVFIHYNGWPSRWDEWIDMTSPRLSLFRSRTSQTVRPEFTSPYPRTILPTAPAISPHDIRNMLPDILFHIQSVIPMWQRVTELVSDNQRSLLTPSYNDVNNGEIGLSNENSTNSILAYDSELKRLLLHLCPIVDRLGRVLTDSSPHLYRLAETIDNRSPIVSLPANNNGTSYQFEGNMNMPMRLSSDSNQIEDVLESLLRSRNSTTNLESFVYAPMRYLAPVNSANGSSSVSGRNASNLDIHITVIAPPTTATNTERHSATLEQSQLTIEANSNHLTSSDLLSTTLVSPNDDEIDNNSSENNEDIATVT